MNKPRSATITISFPYERNTAPIELRGMVTTIEVENHVMQVHSGSELTRKVRGDGIKSLHIEFLPESEQR